MYGKTYGQDRFDFDIGLILMSYVVNVRYDNKFPNFLYVTKAWKITNGM